MALQFFTSFSMLYFGVIDVINLTCTAIARRTEWKGDDDLVRLTRFPMLALMNFTTLLLVSPFAKSVLSETVYDKSRHAVSILLILSVGWFATSLLRVKCFVLLH